MKKINIKTLKTSSGFHLLERKGLIRVLRPTAKVLKTRTKTGAVDVHYKSANRFGGHCLLGVGKRNTKIEFSHHPDNEDIILLNPGAKKYKPLFLVVSLLKQAAFLNALKEEKLETKDLAALKLEFNRSETMFFTVLKNTVHCEVTVPGPGQHPVFFVAEPSNLMMNKIKTDKCLFRITK